MNMLFYYEELYNAARNRIRQLAGISTHRRNSLYRRLKEHTPSFLITAEDIDLVMHNTIASLGAMLCPQAAAEYAGVSKLLEQEMETT